MTKGRSSQPEYAEKPSFRSSDRKDEQVENFFAREDLARRRIVIANDLLHRRAPPLDDGVDSLLERALADELEDLNDTSLPDAVNSIGGLVFADRIPLAIAVDDHRSADEIDCRAAGFQASEEDAPFSTSLKRSIGARADVSFRSRRHARHSFPESRAVEYFFAALSA